MDRGESLGAIFLADEERGAIEGTRGTLTPGRHVEAHRTTSAAVQAPIPGSDRSRAVASAAEPAASSHSARAAARRITSARRRSTPNGWKA